MAMTFDPNTLTQPETFDDICDWNKTTEIKMWALIFFFQNNKHDGDVKLMALETMTRLFHARIIGNNCDCTRNNELFKSDEHKKCRQDIHQMMASYIIGALRKNSDAE